MQKYFLPENTFCSKRPYGVKKTATFISNQSTSKIVHPYDLESDDGLGASVKKECVRFYEVHDTSNIIKISSEIKPENSSNRRIVGGTFNIRQGSQWLTKQADPKKMYALIRRRSEDKKCRESCKKLCLTMLKCCKNTFLYSIFFYLKNHSYMFIFNPKNNFLL